MRLHERKPLQQKPAPARMNSLASCANVDKQCTTMYASAAKRCTKMHVNAARPLWNRFANPRNQKAKNQPRRKFRRNETRVWNIQALVLFSKTDTCTL